MLLGLTASATRTRSSVGVARLPFVFSMLSGSVTPAKRATKPRPVGQLFAGNGGRGRAAEPSGVSVPPLRPTSSVAVPLRSVQATTLVCAPGVVAFWSCTPTGAVADRMCFDGSVNAGASDTGVMTCTDGKRRRAGDALDGRRGRVSGRVLQRDGDVERRAARACHMNARVRVDRGDGGGADAGRGAAQRDAQVVDGAPERRRQSGRVGGRRLAADAEPALGYRDRSARRTVRPDGCVTVRLGAVVSTG